MLALIAILIWIVIFSAWLWVMDRVHREFWYTGKSEPLLALTFYTGGVFGVLLLLGRYNRSPLLSGWVESILERKPGGRVDAAVKFYYRIAEPVRRRSDEFMQRILDRFGIDEIALPAFLASRRGEQAPEPDEAAKQDDVPPQRSAEGPAPDFPEGQERRNPGLNLLAHVLEKAVDRRAEEIHLESGHGRLTVKYLVDGSLETDKILAGALGEQVTAALKSKLQRPLPEEAAGGVVEASVTAGGREVFLGVSARPCESGERIVIFLRGRRDRP